MNDALLDDDEHALTKKSRPFGWFAAGSLLIAGLGFGFAYYLPLHQAHQRLLAEHVTLAQKAKELDFSLKGAVATLARTEARKSQLQAVFSRVEKAEQEFEARKNIAEATLVRELATLVRAKLVAINNEDSGLRLVFSEGALFRAQGAVLQTRAKAALCVVGELLQHDESWGIEVTARVAQDEKAYWDDAAERAAKLAELLESSCEVAGQRIGASVRRPGQSPVSGKEQVTLEILVGPRAAQHLRASDVPPEAPAQTGAPAGLVR